jgi:serine/threonine protein kinase/formylglycine-generating enzyme required for sulfatase activity
MDQSESGHNLTPEQDDAATLGSSSSLELGNVKRVLAVKMEKPESHYTSITQLGKGSFGEVHSARDTLLGREVAIKSLKKQFRDEEEIVDRFLKEARGTSQLEHPNIMPVHEMGVTDDLGIYFTMKKIEGENLKEILDRLEANTSFYIKRYPLNVLLEIFLAVCNGVAFAHSKGVIHRDLKPANIMIGEFGEVLILDWGLVKSLDDKSGEDSGVKLRMDEFDAGSDTIAGAISGTPNYMSPEQAEGNIEDIDYQSDIYSLGAILYHILTYLPPFERTQLRKLLENVKTGNFKPPRKRRPELRIPKELDAICMKAMSRFQVNRYRSVEKFAEDIRNYIGHRDVTAYKTPWHTQLWNACRRHPVKSSAGAAVILGAVMFYGASEAILYGGYKKGLERAGEHLVAAEEYVAPAMEKYRDLEAVSAGLELKEITPEETALQAQLQKLAVDAELEFNLALDYLRSVPAKYQKSKRLMALDDALVSGRINFALDRQNYALAKFHVDNVLSRYAEYIDPKIYMSPALGAVVNNATNQINGYASLEIIAPESVESAIVFPIDKNADRINPGDAIDRAKEFPFKIDYIHKGSYVVMATRADGKFLTYPFFASHAEDVVLEMDVPGDIPEGMAFIPAGDFIFGGAESRFYRQQKLSLPSYFMKLHEVTVGEYLEFWKQLPNDKLKKNCMSRIRFHRSERSFHDAWDANGEISDTARLSLDYPVVGITCEAAEAFCAWKSEQLGAVIRLPTVQEWEKAARGVDGRIYVWGDRYDENDNLTLTRKNAKGKEQYPLWAPPGQFSRDRSIYGVYDMAGNVREWTSTLLPGDNEFYQIKGGSASTPANFLPCSYSSDTPVTPSDVGFRYIMEMPE